MDRLMPTLKVLVLVSTIVLGLLGIAYVVGLFPGEYLGRVISKTMAIMGILTGVSLVAILLAGARAK